MKGFEIDTDESEIEKIDLKLIINNLLSYWYYFLLSIIVCLFIAFLYNRYTKKVYKVSTTILVRDDSNSQLGVENIIEGMEMFSIKTNLENEKSILQSYSLAEKTIKNLNLGVSYFKHATIQSVQQYKNSPIKIVLDSNKAQIAGINFYVKPIDSNTFEFQIKCKDHNTYNLITEKRNNKLKANIDYNKIHKYGEEISTKYFSLIIDKSYFFNSIDYENDEYYSFKIHTIDKLTRKFVSSIDIKPLIKDGSVLELSLTGPNRKKSIDYLNTLSFLYLDRGLKKKNQMATNTIFFIKNQIEKTSDTLEVIENKLEIFKKGIPNLDVIEKEYGTFYQKQKTEGSISEYQVHLSYYYELLNYLKSSDSDDKIISPNSMGISNPELNSLISNFITLNSKKKELELSTTTNHPKYQSIVSQINFSKNSIIENLKNLISSTNKAKKELENRVNIFDNEINSLPENERQYIKLKREFLQTEINLNYLNEKLHATSIAKEGTISDHEILDIAGKHDSDKHLHPKNKLSYILSLIIGLIIPTLIIFLKNFFNEKILSKSDLTKITKIPILGIIGNSDNSSNIAVMQNPKSIISESFRTLRTNIQYLSADKKSKVITITSSVGSEGKTFCSSNLALILSAAGYKTILIGADLRKPKTQTDFNINNKIGLSTYLINKCDLKDILTISKENNNLNIITSGPIPPNPSELLNNERMKNLIIKLKKDFDYIIIDTPPAGLVTDSLITMKFSDINLYVVRHNYTKRNMLNIINDLHKTGQINNINIIINDYQFNSNSYGYGYNYGYGDGYGYYE